MQSIIQFVLSQSIQFDFLFAFKIVFSIWTATKAIKMTCALRKFDIGKSHRAITFVVFRFWHINLFKTFVILSFWQLNTRTKWEKKKKNARLEMSNSISLQWNNKKKGSLTIFITNTLKQSAVRLRFQLGGSYCCDADMFPHLYGFRANISLVQETASKELFEILEKCEGTKVCDEFFFVGFTSNYFQWNIYLLQ